MFCNGVLDGRFVGEIGIAVAVERLLRAGYYVALPIVDDGYDLIAFDDRRSYWRIQVKATGTNGQNRNRIRIGRGKCKTKRYCSKHIDAFICVNARTGVVMCVPTTSVNGRGWLCWSEARKFADFDVLRRIKTKRC